MVNETKIEPQSKSLPDVKPQTDVGQSVASPDTNRKFERALHRFRMQYKAIEDFLVDEDSSTFDDIAETKRELKHYLDMMREIEAEEDDASITDEYDQCYEAYVRICRKIAKGTKIAAAEMLEAETRRNVKPQCYLKKEEPPIFDGSFRNFPAFKRDFKELVQSSVTETIALRKLKKDCLRQDSLELQLVRSKSCIADAWDELDRFFGDPMKIRDSVLGELRNISPVTNVKDSFGLLEIVALVLGAKEDLKACGLESCLADAALSCLMTKVPDELRKLIDRECVQKKFTSAEKCLNAFIQICENEARMELAHELRSGAHGNVPELTTGRLYPKNLSCQLSGGFQKSDATKSKSKSAIGDNGVKKFDKVDSFCAVHGKLKHKTRECLELLNMPAREIKKILEDAKCCLRCFGHHSTSKCTRKMTCNEKSCSNPNTHCRLLHGPCASAERSKNIAASLATKEDRQRVPEVNVQPPDCAASNVKVPTLESEASSGEESDDSNDSYSSACEVMVETYEEASSVKSNFALQLGTNTVRPSHYAFVRKRDGQFKKIQIMYDTGSDLSQVTKEVVDVCGLRSQGHVPDLQVYVAGSKTPSSMGRAQIHDLPIYDSMGKLVWKLKCVSVDYIGKTRKSTYSQVLPQFSDPTNTETLKPSHGCIHVLVGANFPSLLPIPIKVKNNVVLARTKFGDILYGSHASFPKHSAVSQIASSTIQASIDIGHYVLFSTSTNLSTNPCSFKTCSSSDGVVPYVESGMDIPSNCEVSNATVPRVEEPMTESESMTPYHDPQGDLPNPSIQVSTSLRPSERDEFDRFVNIEDQVSCYRCGNCLDSQGKENDRLMEVYRKCLHYDENNRIFVAKMPWTADIDNLPDNRVSALKRLRSLTRSMNKDHDLRDRYIQEFEKCIENGVLLEISSAEDERWSLMGGKVWYLTHFCVINEMSTSTPLRIIFDPTVPFRGMVIDKFWEPPPNLIPEIPTLIIRFRDRPVTIALDIRKAYWSVQLEELESHLHRVLWNRLDESERICTFRIVRNCWGMRPAGSVCSLAMLLLAEMNQREYPSVYDFILRQMYVDDGTFSVESLDEAVDLAKSISIVMAKGGFVVKHFIIGGRNISVDRLDITEPLPESLRFGHEPERILGIQWNAQDDTMTFSTKINFSRKRRGMRTGPDITEEDFESLFPVDLTRRQYLSLIASIFDPTGLVSPFTIILKHELGRIFLLEQGWDEPLPHGQIDGPTATYERCKFLVRKVYDLGKIFFPRCLRPSDWNRTSGPTLVIFCDASQNAYASCAYYNWPAEGRRVSKLVLAKARPLPKKQTISIPRAELLAAQLGVRIAKVVCQSSQYIFDSIYFITDSTIVLGQIANPATKLKSWPASRVDEIQADSRVIDWYHVESQMNIADVATRGRFPLELGSESQWQNGPQFLRHEPRTWPIIPIEKISDTYSKNSSEIDQLELRHIDPRMKVVDSCSAPSQLSYENEEPTVVDNDQFVIDLLLSLNIQDLHDDELWIRAQRRVARLIYFLKNMSKLLASRRAKSLPSNFILMNKYEQRAWINENDRFCPPVTDMILARRYWFIRYQASLPENVELSMKSLNPKKSCDGLWYAHGRKPLGKSFLIIPNGVLARVLLKHYHHPHHPGGRATLAASRHDFWIINGQKLANALVRSCVRCRFLRKNFTRVEIAPLRDIHASRYPVFSNVVLDLCGPYQTIAEHRHTRSNPAHTGKVWAMVIVCASSKAVHIEIVENYDTASFLYAFDTFCNIRGKPVRVIADQGSQIVSAQNTLSYLFDFLDSSKIENHAVGVITWEFIPSGAHWSLGLAERTIRTFKDTMHAITHSKQPTMSKLSFSRTLYSIATIMNSKPLALKSVNVSKLDDDNLIRPNDLLLGRSGSEIDPLIVEPNVSLGKREDYVKILKQKEALLNQFWNKWQHVVFPTLIPREKWYKSGRHFKVGDIVLIKDSNPIRGKFTWGQIEDIHSSSDSVPRTVSVRYSDKLTRSKKEKLEVRPARTVLKSVRDLCLLLPIEESN